MTERASVEGVDSDQYRFKLFELVVNDSEAFNVIKGEVKAFYNTLSTPSVV